MKRVMLHASRRRKVFGGICGVMIMTRMTSIGEMMMMRMMMELMMQCLLMMLLLLLLMLLLLLQSDLLMMKRRSTITGFTRG